MALWKRLFSFSFSSHTLFYRHRGKQIKGYQCQQRRAKAVKGQDSMQRERKRKIQNGERESTHAVTKSESLDRDQTTHVFILLKRI